MTELIPLAPPLQEAAGGAAERRSADPSPFVLETRAREPLDTERLIEMTLATCASKHTRRSYRIQLVKFFATGLPLNREGVALHIQSLRDAGCSGSTLLATNAAIRKLAFEARIRQLISESDYHQICTVKTGKLKPAKAGTWLTPAQVQQLLALPDREDYWGTRDACILAVLAGCGLRRAEMAGVNWSQYQSRDGRMCLVDVLGKGNRHRTLPVPLWAQPDLERWRALAGSGPCPRPDPKTGFQNVNHSSRHWKPERIAGGLAEDGIYFMVMDYGAKIDVELTPHDLRRTLAQMLRRAGAPLEQIQYTLGHASIETTVIYLGSKLELAPGVAAVDLIPLMASTAARTSVVDRVTMALEAERQDIAARAYAASLAQGKALGEPGEEE